MIIYKITNGVNGKVYIGQTKRKSLDRRFYEHCHKSSRCRYIHHALVKYGSENFTIEKIDQVETLDELNEKEKFWIDYYDCLVPKGYNLKTGGHKPKYSIASRTRMSLNHADVSGEKNPMYGVKRSEYTKELIRKAQLGRKLTDIEKHNLRLSSPKRKEVLNIDTGEVFLSTRHAEQTYNLSHDSVAKVCRGKGKTAGGYHWEYVKEGDVTCRK